MTPIDPAVVGQVPGGFAVSNSVPYETNTTATFNGVVTLAFKATRTIYAVTSSFSPFYLARRGPHVKPLFDQTRACKSGNTTVHFELLFGGRPKFFLPP